MYGVTVMDTADDMDDMDADFTIIIKIQLNLLGSIA